MGDRPDSEARASLMAELADAANVLLLEPPATEAGEAACFDLLSVAPPGDEHVLVISADTEPDEWYEAWRRRVGAKRPASIGFVAVGEQARGAAASGEPGTVPPAIAVRPVERPGDLSAIGVALTGLFGRWTDDRQVVVCVRSLGSMLANAELRRTYQFLHILTGQLQTSGAVGHFHLDPARCDEADLNALRTLFDVVVEPDDAGGWSVQRR